MWGILQISVFVIFYCPTNKTICFNNTIFPCYSNLHHSAQKICKNNCNCKHVCHCATICLKRHEVLRFPLSEYNIVIRLMLKHFFFQSTFVLLLMTAGLAEKQMLAFCLSACAISIICISSALSTFTKTFFQFIKYWFTWHVSLVSSQAHRIKSLKCNHFGVMLSIG